MFGFGKKKVHLQAPFAGTVVPIKEVPDEVFAAGMLGDGCALLPDKNLQTIDVHAPVAGTIVTIFPTMHAFAIKTEEGLEVLVHIGLDTVELKGQGFEKFVAKGDTVTAGQLIVRVDVASVTEAGKPLVTPVVMTNKKQVAAIDVKATSAMQGQELMVVTLT